MSTAASAEVRSLAIPDSWLLNVCRFVPLFGDVVSSIRQGEISKSITQLYESSNTQELAPLFDLRKKYMQADRLRYYIWAAALMTLQIPLSVAAATNRIAFSTFARVSSVSSSLAILSANRIFELNSRQREDAALLKHLVRKND